MALKSLVFNRLILDLKLGRASGLKVFELLKPDFKAKNVLACGHRVVGFRNVALFFFFKLHKGGQFDFFADCVQCSFREDRGQMFGVISPLRVKDLKR